MTERTVRVFGNMLYPGLTGFMYGLIAWGPNIFFLVAFIAYMIFTYFILRWMDKIFYPDKKEENKAD